MATEYKLPYTAAELNNRLEKLDGATSNIQTQLDSKANATHNHDSDYDTKGSANTALEQAESYAKSYVDSKTDGLASTSTVDTKINAHNTDTEAHSDIRDAIPTKTSQLTNDSGFVTTDNNTTYTFDTGDSNGQIKVTPSDGSAQNISVNGLGSAAYTESTAYATSAQGTKADNAMPKSGGTFTGTVVAAANNTGTTAMVRNIVYGSESSLASFANTANNGTILIYTS